jgi:hypothetical protein
MEARSRRDFLIKTGQLLILARTGSAFGGTEQAKARTEYLLIADTKSPTFSTTLSATDRVRTNPGFIQVLDITGSSFSIPIPFLGHGFTQNLLRPSEVATFEQYGERGTVVDIKSKRIVSEITCKKNNAFLGHASFSTKHNMMLVTEHNYTSNQGEISVRDPRTLKVIDTFSSFGAKPHECLLIGSDTLVAVNSYQPGAVCIDVNSGKLLRRIPTADTGTAHMDISRDGWMCVGGGQFKGPGGLSMISPSGDCHLLPLDASLIGKTRALSIRFLGGEYVGATFPDSNHLMVWNYKTQEAVFSQKIPGAMGLISDSTEGHDSQALITNSSHSHALVRITFSGKNNSQEIKPYHPGFGACGPHIYRVFA